MTNELKNKKQKSELTQMLAEEKFSRITVSFYRYVKIEEPHIVRDELYAKWSALGAFGRIYLAQEGINAQMSIPEHNYQNFLESLSSHHFMNGIEVKPAVEDDGKSFYKLVIKVRNRIVADGLDNSDFDSSLSGTYLNAKEFNQYLENPGTIVVDMRNHYESEVGRFKNAYCPDADTFRDELLLAFDNLKDRKENNVLMYCTGGIRCEKASAYFKHHGFKNVFHLKGGIIQYAHEVKAQGLESKFIGKNFVFDGRLGERITDDVIADCHQCGLPCDRHVNCKNDDCHLLFIQCTNCEQKMNNCCTRECMEIVSLPLEEQRALRKNKPKSKQETLAVYKSRLRPNLKDLLKSTAR